MSAGRVWPLGCSLSDPGPSSNRRQHSRGGRSQKWSGTRPQSHGSQAPHISLGGLPCSPSEPGVMLPASCQTCHPPPSTQGPLTPQLSSQSVPDASRQIGRGTAGSGVPLQHPATEPDSRGHAGRRHPALGHSVCTLSSLRQYCSTPCPRKDQS